MFSSTDYKAIITNAIDQKIDQIRTVKQRGGQRVFDVTTADKNRLIVKYAEGENDIDMLQAEVHGLELMSSSNTVHIPSIKSHDVPGDDAFFFTMNYVEDQGVSGRHWETFASELAAMHRCHAEQFGLDRDNYIGQMPQPNNEHDNWSDFFTEERLLPEMQWARDSGLHDREDSEMLEELCGKLPDICPEEPPSLTHGDMWSGNVLPSTKDRVYLIDPAVSYAHREMDIAMSKLFGGIPSRFYQAYQQEFPMEGDWSGRIDIYQLYYLLVHVNMFGSSYVGRVRSILNRYSR